MGSENQSFAQPRETDAIQIAALEASLSQPLTEVVRRLVEQQLADLRQQHAALVDGRGATTGDMAGEDVVKGITNVSGTVNGAAVGVNQGTMQLFFGQEPPVDAKPHHQMVCDDVHGGQGRYCQARLGPCPRLATTKETQLGCVSSGRGEQYG
ncbi:MAG: hypothetical protein WCP31_01755 [Chloroflexales bacterium]